MNQWRLIYAMLALALPAPAQTNINPDHPTNAWVLVKTPLPPNPGLVNAPQEMGTIRVASALAALAVQRSNRPPAQISLSCDAADNLPGQYDWFWGHQSGSYTSNVTTTNNTITLTLDQPGNLQEAWVFKVRKQLSNGLAADSAELYWNAGAAPAVYTYNGQHWAGFVAGSYTVQPVAPAGLTTTNLWTNQAAGAALQGTNIIWSPGASNRLAAVPLGNAVRAFYRIAGQ